MAFHRTPYCGNQQSRLNYHCQRAKHYTGDGKALLPATARTCNRNDTEYYPDQPEKYAQARYQPAESKNKRGDRQT